MGRHLAAFANVPLAVFGLMIFVCAFALALAWIIGARPNAFYHKLSRMPLIEEEDQREQ